ncbi:Asp-tRNA(Asn)/Glu-tRNA(Gln) amidotransferase subunit GatC [Roseiterribacter gracilis]|uniref:Aspartyl/glutamyl-tRNA(Asn/Gln) amidotransferase subunit C n=1 Tax=Roseiterribacter gracilis TaxID=2812848 RepID=A0A8S8X958_9PROT|nr:glutamyl-tRNA(Gln) amidotransferase subunit C [Rhodospirillales bacterium TMPK1]
MSLDNSTVAKIARLARIRVGADEQPHLASELNHVLGWIEQLSEVDTKGVEPMTSVAPMTQRLRPDQVALENDRDAVLANAPESVAGFYVVPKVVE